ncbi:tripartite tricarboxylate transporter TctB family protein [Metallumcola ferriviriculae]|uniref:Tripartite tricarboxylate transporter TctB family protein n=1 Tax=Metallumcola ferriviriculae TaxID=3039180 RepID=A0AAU0US20_9FIRM|nr:tripartite tricarboxylate transporter TctB family protein [Desulfitibacteraceae bacterium MK1]
MSVQIGRLIFLAVTWIYALIYYLEVMRLPQLSEKLVIMVAFWVFSAMAITELIKTVAVIRNLRETGPVVSIGGSEKAKVYLKDRRFLMLLGLAIYTYIIPVLGFFISSYIMFCYFSFILGTRKIPTMVFSGLGVVVMVYVLFAQLLKISLPKGMFF